MKLPLLIGGATTSRAHTAVKISPKYSQPAIHVVDASKSVVVAQALMDKDSKNELCQDIVEEYNEIREEYSYAMEEEKMVSIEVARKNGLLIDWTTFVPVIPMQLGTQVFKDYSLVRLAEYIDWTPLFNVWQLRGRYPNRGYPKLFQDKTVGEEAKKVFEDAQSLLNEIITAKTFRAVGMISFHPANSSGDDILVYKDETRQEVVATFYGLRQQTIKEVNKTDPYFCLSDFIAPVSSGKKDYIGQFVCSIHGAEQISQKYTDALDDYNSIMTKALADRLAEAFAEELHEQIRTKFWAYSRKEQLSAEDMHKIKYQGIRPAPGYPSQPDHTEKKTMWNLLNAEEEIGVSLTESLAMNPAASVSGLYFAHPQAKYFGVGKLCKDQLTDYATRKQASLTEMETWLSSNLSYDRDAP